MKLELYNSYSYTSNNHFIQNFYKDFYKGLVVTTQELQSSNQRTVTEIGNQISELRQQISNEIDKNFTNLENRTKVLEQLIEKQQEEINHLSKYSLPSLIIAISDTRHTVTDLRSRISELNQLVDHQTKELQQLIEDQQEEINRLSKLVKYSLFSLVIAIFIIFIALVMLFMQK